MQVRCLTLRALQQGLLKDFGDQLIRAGAGLRTSESLSISNGWLLKTCSFNTLGLLTSGAIFSCLCLNTLMSIWGWTTPQRLRRAMQRKNVAYSTRPFTVQALSTVARTVCQIGTRCRKIVHHCSAGAQCSKLEI